MAKPEGIYPIYLEMRAKWASLNLVWSLFNLNKRTKIGITDTRVTFYLGKKDVNNECMRLFSTDTWF